MGAGGSQLAFTGRPPTVILLAGLQGSGKTTTAGEARAAPAEGRPAAGARRRRPPASRRDRPARAARAADPGSGLSRRRHRSRRGRARRARSSRGRRQSTSIILDTAGRLHVDEALMDELERVRDEAKPANVLLVLDAMTGQEAVNVAQAFQERHRVRRRRDDEARRRRARRRGALRQGGHRQADQARLGRREARPARVLPPRPDGVAHPRHGRRADADRARRGGGRGGRAEGARGAACSRASSPSTTS